MNKLQLKTERLKFYSFDEKDVKILADWHQDPNLMKFIGEGELLGKEDSQKTLQKILLHQDLHGLSLWKAYTDDGKNLIGRCGFWWWDTVNGEELEVGWMIIKSHQNKGYASEAARALIKYGFLRTNKKYIVAFIHPDNQASAKVAIKAGMDFHEKRRMKGVECEVFRIDRP